MGYVDANALASLYLNYNDQVDVAQMLTSRTARQHWPFRVTTLLQLEFRNAVRKLVHETRNGGQWRVTPEQAAVALAGFEDGLAGSDMLRLSDLSLEAVVSEFDSLSARFTMREGYRTYDIIHVASALQLGCKAFWSFDRKALQLAKAVGLKVNP